MMMSQRVASVSPMWNRSLSIVWLALNEKETPSVCRRANTTPPHTPHRRIQSYAQARTQAFAAHTNTHTHGPTVPREVFFVLTGLDVLVGNRLHWFWRFNCTSTQRQLHTHTHEWTNVILWSDALRKIYHCQCAIAVHVFALNVFVVAFVVVVFWRRDVSRNYGNDKMCFSGEFSLISFLSSCFCILLLRNKGAKDVTEFKMARFVYINSHLDMVAAAMIIPRDIIKQTLNCSGSIQWIVSSGKIQRLSSIKWDFELILFPV